MHAENDCRNTAFLLLVFSQVFVLLFCQSIAQPVFLTCLVLSTYVGLFRCMVSFKWSVPNPFCYVNLDFKFLFMDSQSRGLKLKVSQDTQHIGRLTGLSPSED